MACGAVVPRRRARLSGRLGSSQVQRKIWHLAGSRSHRAQAPIAGSTVVGAQPQHRLCQGPAEGNRGMSNRRKPNKLAPWIPMDRHQYRSAAFGALSAVAQAMLVHLTYNYNTKMMNTVWMSARLGAKKLNVGKTAAALQRGGGHAARHYEEK